MSEHRKYNWTKRKNFELCENHTRNVDLGAHGANHSTNSFDLSERFSNKHIQAKEKAVEVLVPKTKQVKPS